MDVRSIAERVLALPQVRFVMAVLDTYGKAPGGILANGLAFAALFSALPTTLLLLGIGGLVAQDPAFQAKLADALAEAFPPLADLFEEALSAVSQGAGIASIIGLLGLLWGVSQFYATLDLAFSRIFSDAPERDFARRTLRGFVWVLLLIGAVLVVIILAGLSSFLDTLLPDRLDSMRPIRTLRHVAVDDPRVRRCAPSRSPIASCRRRRPAGGRSCRRPSSSGSRSRC